MQRATVKRTAGSVGHSGALRTEQHDVELAIDKFRARLRKEILITFEATSREMRAEAPLAGGTLEDLERANLERQQSMTLAAEFDRLPEIATGVKLDEEVKRARESRTMRLTPRLQRRPGRERAMGFQCCRGRRGGGLRSARIERVTRLGRTLALALEFSRRKGVHRDIAPHWPRTPAMAPDVTLVATATRGWIPAIWGAGAGA